MKKIIILILIICLPCVSQARIARFYFSRANACSCRADRYDNPIDGTFIIEFDTTNKTISVSYNVPGVKPYFFKTKYKSVKETHNKTENIDYYYLAESAFGGENDYMIVNTYSKGKGYGVTFSLPYGSGRCLFGDKFLEFFGAPSDWDYWPEIFFEKPYKMDSNPTAETSSSATISNTLTNRIYSGVVHSNVDEYLENTLIVHFLTSNKLRIKMNTKIKGSDEISALGIVQLMMEAEGEDSQEGLFDYTYRNGHIIIKGSTDRFQILNGGKQLRWYIESSDERAKKFNGSLKRIQ